MGAKKERPFRQLLFADRRVLILGLGLAGLYWILESLMDAFVLKTSGFPQSLVYPAAQELWMRLSVLALILLSWVALQSLLFQRRRSEEALRGSEEKFAKAFRLGPDSITLSRFEDGAFLEVNEGFSRLTGYAPEEVLGRSPAELGLWARPEERDALREALRSQGLVEDFEVLLARKDGGRVIGALSAATLDVGDERLVLVSTRDVTEERRAQEALRHSEERYRNVYSMTPLALVLWAPDRTVLDWNQRAEEIFGWKRAEVLGRDFFDFLIPEGEKPDVEVLVAGILARRLPTLSENHNLTKGGQLLDCEWYTSLLFDGEGRVEGIISLGLDITERKRIGRALRESEEKHRGLYEAVSGGVVVQDRTGKIVEANPEACDILGMTQDQMRGLTSADPCWHSIREDGSPFPGEDHPLPVTLRTGRPVRGVLTGVFNPSLQKYRWILVNSEPILDPANGQVQAAVATFVDITERKETEIQIRAALEEKEVLLREVHHRVKNNLQVISTLLDLQAATIGDDSALKAFQESQNRVLSMALIHEKLYQSESLAQVDFTAYITDITSHLLRAYGISEARVSLSLDVREVPLSIDTAILLGLILNELVSNCLKYAFPADRAGQIRVGFRSGPEGIRELTVGDDGVGLPEDLDFRNTDSLGLQLVCTLVRQLGGTIEVVPGTGTTFKITFQESPGRQSIPS